MKTRSGPVTKAVSDEGNRPARVRWEAFARIPERLAARPWVYRLARLGYAAEGLLYVIVGGAASQRRRARDSTGG